MAISASVGVIRGEETTEEKTQDFKTQDAREEKALNSKHEILNEEKRVPTGLHLRLERGVSVSELGKIWQLPR